MHKTFVITVFINTRIFSVHFDWQSVALF